jgi:hypothetical protein
MLRGVKMKIILLLIMVLFILGCAAKELTELQVTACESADEGGTCDTKLEDLNIVTKEECCQILDKCC